MRPPAWLSSEAKKVWKEIIPLIPGLNLGLDRAVVTMYAVTAARVKQVREALTREDLSVQERQAYQEILSIEEKQLFELAGELGLTPQSRREIKRALKLHKRNKKP